MLAATFTFHVDRNLDLIHIGKDLELFIQVQTLLASDNAELKGIMKSLVVIARNQGWKQLFSGLSINYIKVVSSVAIGFTVYDTMKSYLRVPSRDDAAVEVVTNNRISQPSSQTQ
ncbi:mitochondrial carrier protein CoAc2 isoform X2 [Arachis hypogaea]|uniref:Graves disease carrier protein n=1 Tax=Arachis hypogaea TaxID=3818 RepID=A0A444XN71_ARAHY|nr:Graves disease carrier protein [Arachis hypogaea]RYQ91056.1 hypothetical protein Ahy_B09g096924 isoform A [Arachis hypogaea]